MLRRRVGPIDVVIADGGHTMSQQIATFEVLWAGCPRGRRPPRRRPCTPATRTATAGGYKRPGAFIEHAKGLMDQLNAWHSEDPAALSVDTRTRSIRGMHGYDSIVVLDKGTVRRPRHERTGTRTPARLARLSGTR